jgi:hypothetical protein
MWSLNKIYNLISCVLYVGLDLSIFVEGFKICFMASPFKTLIYFTSKKCIDLCREYFTIASFLLFACIRI